MGKKKPGNPYLQELEDLRSALSDMPDDPQAVEFLLLRPKVAKFLKENPIIQKIAERLKPQEKRLLLEAIASEKAGPLFKGVEKLEDPAKACKKWASSIKPLYTLLSPIDGILGYILLAHKVINKKTLSASYKEIDPPPVISIDAPSKTKETKTKERTKLNKWIRQGIESMPMLAEVYPIGGCGERLGLRDEKTKEPLPQALLEFQERTLLEGMIRDLEAREELYRKLCKKKVLTPVVLMTSLQNNNRHFIEKLLRERGYFGRGEESFFLMDQPNVPVIDIEGFLQAEGPFSMEMKPGGHGALWLLLEKLGGFDWLKKKKRSKLLIRQINNPLAGTDYNLLALLGYGVLEKKQFGFLSCPRQKGNPEGMNVLVKTHNEDGDFCTISNVEYTEVEEIKTAQAHPDLFPANTNILFADVEAVQEATLRNPLPGMIFNSKNGKTGRLESTMQNIADAFAEPAEGLPPQKTFVLLNRREKTLSVTKHVFHEGEKLDCTPQGTFFDLQKLWGQFLQKESNCTLVEFKDPLHPSYILDISPKVGPLWAIIRKKLSKLTLAKGAEFRIDCSDVLLEMVSIDGSLLIEGDEGARILFKNVAIVNRGVDYSHKAPYWRGRFRRKEACRITIEKGAELIAENVELKGPLDIHVPEGHSLTIVEKKGGLDFILKKKKSIPPLWQYEFREDDSILLTFKRDREKIIPTNIPANYEK